MVCTQFQMSVFFFFLIQKEKHTKKIKRCLYIIAIILIGIFY